MHETVESLGPLFEPLYSVVVQMDRQGA